jgi:hypothetical protein
MLTTLNVKFGAEGNPSALAGGVELGTGLLALASLVPVGEDGEQATIKKPLTRILR